MYSNFASYDTILSNIKKQSVPKKRRVVFYGRVSTEHLEQLSALENQMSWYDNIAASHDDWEIVDKYIDEGITGTSVKKRKAFLKMIQDAKSGKFDLIVTREVCRFARNTIDTLMFTRALKDDGVEVYFVNDNIWTLDGDGELRLTIMATLAQEESRKVSERVNAGLRVSQEKGVLRGSKILGYDRVGKTFKINEEESKTVKMMFELYVKGYGFKAISRILEENHRLTATGKTVWHPSNVQKIITNPFYIGYQVQNKTKSDGYLTQRKIKTDESERVYVKGDYPIFLSEELFNMCQNIRNDRRTITDDNTISGKQIHKSVWLKKLQCSCGSSFRRVKWSHSKKHGYSYGYQCYSSINYTKHNQERYCGVQGFSEWKVQLATYNAIDTLFSMKKEDVIQKTIETIEKHFHFESSEKTCNTEELTKELEKITNRLKQYAEMRADGEITKEEFLTYRDNCDKQINDIRMQLDSNKNLHSPNTYDKDEIISNIKMKLSNLFDSCPEKTNGQYDDKFVDVFVNKIIVYDKHKFSIYFNLDGSSPYNRKITGSIYNQNVQNLDVPIAYSTNRGSYEQVIGVFLSRKRITNQEILLYTKQCHKQINLRNALDMEVNIYLTA